MADLQFDAGAVPLGPTFDNLPDLPAITQLKSRAQWVAWKYELRPGAEKPTKPLIAPRSGFKASHSEPRHWAGYSDAVTRVVRSGLEGVGYVLSEDDNLTGGDLDDCRDSETGVLQDWAADIVALAETYIEISPSGQGLRIIWEGKVPEAIVNHPAQVEVYGRQRYLTITGRHLEGTPTEIRPAPRTEAALRARAARFEAPPIAPPATPQNDEPVGDKFFSKVNTAALDSLSSWVPSIFPMAKYQPGTGAYRVPARALGDNLQEDLSISPKGIVYFGVADMGDSRRGKRSPIDLAHEFGGQRDIPEAAFWLCDKMGRTPAFFGWKEDNSAKGAELANQLLSKSIEKDEFDATPWEPFDWADMPPRAWIYGKHYIRQFVTTTISPGGVGKTSLVLAEAVAMVTGKPILGIHPDELANVWVWNGEDPMNEIKKRVRSICDFHKVDQTQLSGLFIDSGRQREIVLAEETKSGTRICVPIYEKVVQTILKHKIDVFIVDPFVSSHQVNENDNNAIDLVAKAWARIADTTNCSVELVHHARKTGGQEVTVEHARGAVALISASRSARTLNPMSDDEVAKLGKENLGGLRQQFFRVDNGKANMALPSNRSRWFKMETYKAPNGGGGLVDNGDEIGVPTVWEWPNALVGVTAADLIEAQKRIGREPKWRADVRASGWVGHALGDLLDADSMDRAGQAKISGVLKVWIEKGALKVVSAPDVERKARSWVVAGDEN